MSGRHQMRGAGEPILVDEQQALQQARDRQACRDHLRDLQEVHVAPPVDVRVPSGPAARPSPEPQSWSGSALGSLH